MRSKIKICLWQKKSNLWNFHFFLHKSIVNASIWCQKTSRSVCQHFWMKSKSLVFGGFLDLSGENGSNIVNNQLTGLILLCKVFETSSQSSKCLLVLPYQWLVRHRQKKFHLSLVFAYCMYPQHSSTYTVCSDTCALWCWGRWGRGSNFELVEGEADVGSSSSEGHT